MKKGLVKAVPSGDSIILEGVAPPGKAPPTRVLNLAYLEVPTLALPGMTSAAWAWEAREFLRNLLIGQRIEFNVEYSMRSSEYGIIYLNGAFINQQLVRQGLARVKSEKSSSVLNELMAAQQEARKAGLGVWSSQSPAPISIQPTTDYDPRHLVNGRHTCLVEEVTNGITMYLLILGDMGMIKMVLDGVQCPPPTQQIGLEAKLFTQRLLLHRQVECELSSMDDHKNFVGRIIHPKGDITQQLLKKGLARITNQCNELALGSQYHRMLKESQGQAQSQRVKIWEEFKGAKLNVTEKTFEAKVVEIHSGDSLSVRSLNSGITKRLMLASIRSPALGNPRKGTSDAAWAFDAREFLRNLAIGKTVDVEIEYVKKFTNDLGENTLEFASVISKGVNLGVAMVEAGFATVQYPRADEEGSKYLMNLREAEDGAKKARRNMHSSDAAPKYRINDLIGAGNQQKIRTFSAALLNQKHLGIVEHVFSGTRFKVRIPKQNCALMLGIQGIRSFAPDPNQPEQDRIAKEAIEFARSTIFQREVDVEIISVDQRGTFIGHIFVQKRNYAVPLLEQGLAYTQGPRAGPYQNVYEQAERVAENEKVGVFNPKLRGLFGGETVSQTEPVQVFVTEIVDARKLFVQFKNDSNIERINKIMAQFSPYNAPQLQPPIKQGVRCAALFAEDGQWYRAKVERKVGDNYRVHFVDFGNSEEVPQEDLRQLTGPALEVQPLAHECQLSYIIPRSIDQEFGFEAGQALRDLTWEQEISMKVTGEDRGVLNVVLSRVPGELEDTVNSALVERGLAKVSKFAKFGKDNPYLPFIARREEEARRCRLGLWEISDGSDEEDFQ